MFCRECGTQLADHMKFCPKCGTPAVTPTAETPATPNPAYPPNPTPNQNAYPPPPTGTTPTGTGSGNGPDFSNAEAAFSRAAASVKDWSGKAGASISTALNRSPVPEEMKFIRENPFDPTAPMSYDKKDFKKPAEYKNLALFFLFIFLSLGLYFWYSVYRLTKFSNQDESMTKRSPGLQVFLCIILPALYWAYWSYQTAKRIENILAQRTGKTASIATGCAILSFFGLGFISMLIMQDKINKAVGGITGSNMDADGIGTCKECGIHFPNDVSACPNCGAPYKKPFYESTIFKIVAGLLIITILGSIIGGIVSSATSAATTHAARSAARKYSDGYYYMQIEGTLTN